MSREMGAGALFLHAPWRSAGTWMWGEYRRLPGVVGLYEPLHEQLATLTPALAEAIRPGIWNSGHPAGPPYFAEYAPLIRPEGGVRGYRPEFAMRDFFAAGPLDPALRDYLRGLLALPGAPVLKFCRSLGRVGAMQAAFPAACHATLLRHPLAQWRSAEAQWVRDGNRYFLLQPMLALSHGRRTPLVRAACTALGVSLPGRHPALPQVRAEEWVWRHVTRLSWAERYRAFVAFWVASAVASLGEGTLLVDTERWQAPAVAEAVAEAIAAATGLRTVLAPRGGATAAAGEDEARLEAGSAHAAARGVVAAWGQRLPPGHRAAVLEKLAGDGEMRARARAGRFGWVLEPWEWHVTRRWQHWRGERAAAGH